MNPMMQAIVGSGLGSITMPLVNGRIRQLDFTCHISFLYSSNVRSSLSISDSALLRSRTLGLLAILLSYAWVCAL